MNNRIRIVGVFLFFGSFFLSCETKKSADPDPELPCVDAYPVFKQVDYETLSMWGVPHVDSLEGGYRVFTAKWDVPAMMCPQDTVRVTISCYMSANQIRPIILRAYLEFQFGLEHSEPIPLIESEGIWANIGALDPWIFFPSPYFSGEEVGFMVVHVDYLVPPTENFFDDLDYLYANAEGVIISCDYSGWLNK